MSLLEQLLQEPSSQERLSQLMSMVSTQPGINSLLDVASPGPDNNLDLMTRHGVTLDAEALQSLIAAKRAGFNAFPYIGSSYRSAAEQAQMYANRAGRSIPVAPPGQSLHQQGIAFDAGSLPSAVRQYLLQHGWFWGSSFGDPVHYSYGELG